MLFNIASIFLIGCNSREPKNVDHNNLNLHNEISTLLNKNDNERIKQFPIDYEIDSIIDTSTLSGKRNFILYNFAPKSAVNQPDYYSLVDLNYDNYEDFIIGYYGATGTGFKHRIKVYLYNQETKSYLYCNQLSDLPNPSFYIQQKKITSFYIGAGGGSGEKLEWINKKWVRSKEFSVDNQGDSSIWKISYPLKNEVIFIKRPFVMIPPNDILEINIEL